jgi:OOP family OmpA-OmpF porin
VENDGEFVVRDPIVFRTGKDQLEPESIPALGVVASYLRAKPEVTLLRVEVHTDSMGDDQANQVLSELRALTVARFLVANGIDCRRLVPVGFGETKPIAPNITAEGRATNRRTAFFTAAVRGKALNRRPVDGGGKIAGDVCR